MDTCRPSKPKYGDRYPDHAPISHNTVTIMDTMILSIFALLLAFQAKHFVVDFIIQLNRKDGMSKFNENGWVWPLAKHAFDHAACTFLISTIFLFIFNQSLIVILVAATLLMLADFCIHFTVDRIKASPHLLGRYKVTDKPFWVALGADQTMHHLTHYAIIFALTYTVLG